MHPASVLPLLELYDVTACSGILHQSPWSHGLAPWSCRTWFAVQHCRVGLFFGIHTHSPAAQLAGIQVRASISDACILEKRKPSRWKSTHFTKSQGNTSKNIALKPRTNRWDSQYWNTKWHLDVCQCLSLMINWVGVLALYVLPESFHFCYFLWAEKIGPYSLIKTLLSACLPM